MGLGLGVITGVCGVIGRGVLAGLTVTVGTLTGIGPGTFVGISVRAVAGEGVGVNTGGTGNGIGLILGANVGPEAMVGAFEPAPLTGC